MRFIYNIISYIQNYNKLQRLLQIADRTSDLVKRRFNDCFKDMKKIIARTTAIENKFADKKYLHPNSRKFRKLNHVQTIIL
jgi:hypothetical protein